jgi:hypothetical protein
MNSGTTLALITSDGRHVHDLDAVTIACGDGGVQILLHLNTDTVEIDADDTTDIAGTLNDLLAKLEARDDDEED